MLRVIHSQEQLNRLVLTDIDDGLPNKTSHRLGSSGDPKAYKRDGYANSPKQPCYVPYSKPTDSSLPGYIDLRETQSVVHSAGKGCISKMVQAGWATVVSFQASDLAAPVLTSATLDAPGPGDLTLAGTNFTSLTPNTSTVFLTGTGAVTLTQDAILTGGGSISDTTIVIPAALVPGVAVATTFAQVRADDQLSAVVAVAL